MAEDDGVREQHGLTVGAGDKRLLIQETDGTIYLDATYQALPMTPQQARYFARKLYRLARRVEQRKVGE